MAPGLSSATLSGTWSYGNDIIDFNPAMPMNISVTLSVDGSSISGSGGGSTVPSPGGNFQIDDVAGTVQGSTVSLSGTFKATPYGEPTGSGAPIVFQGSWDGGNALTGSWSGAHSWTDMTMSR
ncbi:MAG: hypothetical protein AB7O67_18585 [Vicinamibacterales bacterium]